jgi:hypothetical protein
MQLKCYDCASVFFMTKARFNTRCLTISTNSSPLYLSSVQYLLWMDKKGSEYFPLNNESVIPDATRRSTSTSSRPNPAVSLKSLGFYPIFGFARCLEVRIALF